MIIIFFKVVHFLRSVWLSLFVRYFNIHFILKKFMNSFLEEVPRKKSNYFAKEKVIE